MNWRTVKLAEVATINPRRTEFDINDDTEVTFVPMEAVDEITGQIISSRIRPYREVRKGYTAFSNGDVIFAKITPCMQNGKHAIARNLHSGIGFGSTEFHVIRPGADILPEWIHYLLRRKETLDAAIRTFTGAVGQQRVPPKFLEELELPLPRLEEQRRIAAQLKAQLAAVEEARRAARAQLSDAKRLIPAILETAFTGAADAERVRIGDVANTTSGTTPSRGSREYWQPATYPWVKTGEVNFSPITDTDEHISERALAECSLSLLPPGTVLIAMYGQGKTRGQSAVLEVAATTNQACFAILPNEAFDSEYLQFWLRHSYGALRAQSDARGGNQSNLNGGMLNAFQVPLIPRDRQEGIAKQIKASLAEAQQLQAALEGQLNEIERLPARLLAQAFEISGEVHV
jgi:type I restriction enzyme S subunit